MNPEPGCEALEAFEAFAARSPPPSPPQDLHQEERDVDVTDSGADDASWWTRLKAWVRFYFCVFLGFGCLRHSPRLVCDFLFLVFELGGHGSRHGYEVCVVWCCGGQGLQCLAHASSAALQSSEEF